MCNNQGIVHLKVGGTISNITGYPRLACKRMNAHMAVGPEGFDAEPRKCVRCAAHWEKMKAAKARREAAVGELRGKDLVCWYVEEGRSHGDVLLEMANRPVSR